MGTVPFWTDEDIRHGHGLGFWDGCFMSGTALPGIWRLEISKERSIEKQKQGGIDGNRLKDKGYVGGVGKLTGIIWLAEQLEELEKFLPTIDPKVPGASRNPIDFYHPASHLMSIFSVYIKKITIQQLTTQILTINIDLDEWFPKVKPATPKTDVKGFDGASNAQAPNAVDFAVGPPQA